MDRDLRCLRCGGKMEYQYTEYLQLGKNSFFGGSLNQLAAGALLTDIYRCQGCGKLEFFRGDFFDGEGEEAGSIAETRCPSCGVRYEMDYPKCPRCGAKNENW